MLALDPILEILLEPKKHTDLNISCLIIIRTVLSKVKLMNLSLLHNGYFSKQNKNKIPFNVFFFTLFKRILEKRLQ